MVQSNLDAARIDEIAAIANEIRVWISDRDHPEHYPTIVDLEMKRSFLYSLDLLETVLTRFEIGAYFSRLALERLAGVPQPGSLGWDFWQIDIEEFFASNLLELCYQLSNAWVRLDGFADKERAFAILRRTHREPKKVILARHKASHFQPDQFQDHRVAQQYSILRRPYQIRDGKLEKELAKVTMPKVATLIRDSITEGYAYLKSFREATIG